MNNLTLSSVPFIILSLGSATAKPKAILDIDAELPKAKIAVWTPLFQAGWDKLNSLHKQPLSKTENASPLMKKLDAFKWNEELVMPSSPQNYKLYAGKATQEFIDKTTLQMQQDFGEQPNQNELTPNPGGFMVLGILKQNLTFPTPFFSSKTSGMKFTAGDQQVHKVSFFGSAKKASKRFRNQVSILAYDKEATSFTVQLKTKVKDEFLIIHLPSSEQTFQSAITSINKLKTEPLKGKWGELADPKLHENDTLKIPQLKFSAKKNFAPLLNGTRYYGKDLTQWRIATANLKVDFQLDKQGAKVLAQSSVADDPFGGTPPLEPRQFICNKPFFVFMWKKEAKLPYFGAHIDGKEGLIPFKKVSK